MSIKSIAPLFLLCTSFFCAFSQTPQAQFSLPTNGCIGEHLAVLNQSVNATRYEWDICQGDLALSPTGSILGTLTGSNIPLGIDIVFDGSIWYGFATSRNSNSIYRFTFGSSFSSITSVTNLGNISSKLTQPVEIKIISDNGKWYGFVGNQSGSVGTSLITRIDFGTSLNNSSPVAVSLIDDVTFATDAGLDVIRSGSAWYITYTQIGLGPTYKVGILRLPTIESVPEPANMLSIPFTGTPSLHDIKIIESSDQYYAYVVTDSQLFQLNFGSDIFSTPSPTDISTVLPSGVNPYGVDGDYDNGNYYLLLSTDQGSLLRIDLGNDLTQSPLGGQNLGGLGVFSNNRKLSLVKDQTSWYAFSVGWSSGNIYRASFPSPACEIVPGFFTDQNLQLIFNNSGVKHISLASFDGAAIDEEHKSITISSLNAPTLDFSNQQICIQNPIQFTYTSDQSITAQSWDFGDGQTSSVAATENVYSSVGSYEVTLNVSASNGCTNTAKKSIKVYDQPSSTFTLPPGLICTNNEFTFTNNTVDNFDGNLTYQWYVDNNLEANSRDLKYTFSSGGNLDIKLKTSIPGCSSELTQTLNNIQSGPTVNFDYVGQCENELITFTNNSVGDISGYIWDFGNGQTSTEVNVTQNYSNGNYIVSLQTTGINGCISSTNKPLTIYSAPQTDFSLDLPPFSCTGTPSQFNDLTPSPIDSNLSSWSWSFGDTGTAIVKNATHTYSLAGAYDVSLVTTTNFGCTSTKIKTIQIEESPTSDFTLNASCLNKPTLFTDASGENNKSWLWKIDGTSYTIQNPTHVFSALGNFIAELMVTGNNECISIISKPIVVHIPPTLNFSSENNCATQVTLFNDVTAPNDDPAVSRVWDFAGMGGGKGASTQFSFPAPGTHNVTLKTTSQSGCSYSLTKSTIIVAAPIADFSFSDESGPPPLAVQFTNASQHATSYYWQFNDPNNSDSFLESPSVTYTTLGDFSVDLTASNVQGCVDTKSKVIHVIIPSTEVELEQFTLLYDQLTGSVRPVLSIKNNSNYTINNIDVVLDIGGNALVKEEINITVLPSATASQIMKYELLPGSSQLDYLCVELQLTESRLSDEENLTNNNACVSLESNEILLPPYPNPTQGQLYFDWIAVEPGSVNVSIVTQMGQLAYQKNVAGVEVGLNQIVLDVSKLNSGFYLLIFESAGRSKTFPFVIQN
jgi:PKD repeat protein